MNIKSFFIFTQNCSYKIVDSLANQLAPTACTGHGKLPLAVALCPCLLICFGEIAFAKMTLVLVKGHAGSRPTG